jgi:hypothetical protein
MMANHILVLVTLNADNSDVAGNTYPDSGIVQSNSWTTDKNILHGLCGILWGRCGDPTYLKITDTAIWAVVKVDIERVIKIDDFILKFKTGLVVFSGKKSEASKFILKYKKEHFGCEYCFHSSEIAGHIDNADISHHAISQGFEGEARSNIPGLHSIAMETGSRAITSEMESHAVSLGSGSYAGTIEDFSDAVVLEGGPTAWSSGNKSKSVSTGQGYACSTGYEGISACLAPNSIGCAGKNGCLIMAYDDDERIRFAVGYVGENINSNISYRCEHGKFISTELPGV